MPTTHDIQASAYREEYVPAVADSSHWSNSPEWIAYQRARAAATRLYAADSPNRAQIIDDTPEVRVAFQAFHAAFPPEEPEPKPALSARDAELRAAEIELQRAVDRMRKLAHPDRIVGLVQRMVNE